MLDLVARSRRAAHTAFAAVLLICAFGVARAQAGASARRDTKPKKDARTPVSLPDSVRLRATLAGHGGDIIAVEFSPDGRTLATGAEDGTLRLWDAQTGEPRASIRLTKRLDDLVVRWSPDGASLATYWGKDFGPRKDHLQVWDARDGHLRAALAGHRWDVNTFEWSPDGRRLLTASEDGTARVWDAFTGDQLAEIVFEKLNTDKYTESLLKATFTDKRLPEFVSLEASFTDGGRGVLVSSTARPPQIYNTDGQPVAPPLTVPTPSPRESPKVLDKSSVLRAGGMALMRTAGQSSPPSQAYYPPPTVSPDGRLVVTAAAEGLRVWDAATGERRYTLVGAGGESHFSPDSRRLLTTWRGDPLKWVGDSTSLKLWDAETGELMRSYDDLPSPYAVFWSPDGAKVVITGYAKTKERVLELRDGRVTARLPWEGCTPDSLFGDGGCDPFILSADGRATLKLKGQLKLFSTTDGALLAELTDSNRRAAFSPTDPRLLAARSRDKRSIYLLELALK